MAQHTMPHLSPSRRAVSRRSVLQAAATTSALVLATGATSVIQTAEAAQPTQRTPDGAALQPRAAIPGILDALRRHPLVAMTERHLLQEWHDVITALLCHPSLPGTINDIVVEFGNAAYQDLADRFVLGDTPVANADLAQIWRQIGDTTWNAPVYAQFFRTVRAINWMQPPQRRIRVLLGQAPITMDAVIASPANRTLANDFVVSTTLNTYYAALVEREVLAKGRRALLTAGGGHTLRGLRDDNDPHQLNAVSLLAQRHAGALYVIDLLILPPGPQQDPLTSQVHAAVARWPRPALASLAGTWLGASSRTAPPWINEMADRTINAAAARYEEQADAVLYLGPGEVLTASRPDPAIYHWGAYPEQLHRLDPLVSHAAGAPIDGVAMGLQAAQAGPSWFATS